MTKSTLGLASDWTCRLLAHQLLPYCCMFSRPAKPVASCSALPSRNLFQVLLDGFQQRLGIIGLNSGDLLYLLFLAVSGAGIWVRDTAWLSAADETLPILAAIPLFVWLGAPWRFRENSYPLPHRPLVVAALLAAVGIATDLTILLASAWTLSLWTWVKARVGGEAVILRRLAILPFMAFPWVALDLAPVGWGFRLSAAWVADQVYGAAGFSVLREGTILQVNSIPIEVAAPCSGMNSLQAILLGGMVLTWMEFGRNRLYWWLVASLPLMAWVANTMRVCSVIATAVVLGPDAARGSLHQIGGWAVVLVVFGAWSLMLKWIARTFQKATVRLS